MLPKHSLVSLFVLSLISRLALNRGLSSTYFHFQPQETKRNQRDLDNCKALALHESGHWEHHYASQSQYININGSVTSGGIFNGSSSSLIQETYYFPREIDWMMGKDWPENGWGDDESIQPTVLMYLAGMGNQGGGGCAVEGFQPSLSTWVPAIDTAAKAAGNVQFHHDNNIVSPSLRLIERLAKANNTLCLMGDSIDHQIYDALRHNLMRQISFQNQINISVSETKITPVNYTNETGTPPYIGWMTMSEVRETIVSLQYNNGDDSTVYTTAFKYLKAYGWSPWNTVFMEDCNIITYTLGLHYDAAEEMIGTHWGGPKYQDDFRAAVTYLADFEASQPNRIAVWRSTLPQHFNTSDGHYVEESSSDGHYVEESSCAHKQMKTTHERSIQKYNNATDVGFEMICEQQREQSCSHGLEHTCTVNRTSMEYRTLYKYLVENNCTERLERFEGISSNVSGKILRWNIADLFDVPTWHSDQHDCSHFCYVPPLYEAAFERLNLLLPGLA